MKVIEGGLPSNISSCLSDIRSLVRKTQIIDGNKNVDVLDILALIDYWDCEDYFLQNSVRISPNTVINLKSKEKP